MENNNSYKDKTMIFTNFIHKYFVDLPLDLCTSFLSIMDDFTLNKSSLLETLERIQNLLHGNPKLVMAFNKSMEQEEEHFMSHLGFFDQNSFFVDETVWGSKESMQDVSKNADILLHDLNLSLDIPDDEETVALRLRANSSNDEMGDWISSIPFSPYEETESEGSMDDHLQPEEELLSEEIVVKKEKHVVVPSCKDNMKIVYLKKNELLEDKQHHVRGRSTFVDRSDLVAKPVSPVTSVGSSVDFINLKTDVCHVPARRSVKRTGAKKKKLAKKNTKRMSITKVVRKKTSPTDAIPSHLISATITKYAKEERGCKDSASKFPPELRNQVDSLPMPDGKNLTPELAQLKSEIEHTLENIVGTKHRHRKGGPCPRCQIENQLRAAKRAFHKKVYGHDKLLLAAAQNQASEAIL